MDIQELNNDQIYELVKELLPQLEQDIRKDVEEQMKQEYEQRLQRAADEIQQNALKELDSIFMDVQSETQKQFEEKLKELDLKEKELEEQFNDLETVVRNEVEQKVKESFEEEKKQLVSTIIEEINKQGFNEDIEIKIREKIRQEYEDDIKKEMQKREKQMKVNLQKKLENEKKQLEDFYKLEIKAKIDKEKKLLEKEKSELARLKSLKNVKVNKLEEEKNKIKSQLTEQEKSYNVIVDNLQNQIKEITSQIERFRKDMNVKGILKNTQTHLNQNQSGVFDQQGNRRGSFQNTSGNDLRDKSPKSQYQQNQGSQQDKENNATHNRRFSNGSNGFNQQGAGGFQEDAEFQKKYLSNTNKNPFLLSQTQNNLLDYQNGQLIQEQNQSAAFQQQIENKNQDDDVLNTFDPLSPPPSTYQKKFTAFNNSGSKAQPAAQQLHLIGQPKSSLEIYNEYQKKLQSQSNGQMVKNSNTDASMNEQYEGDEAHITKNREKTNSSMAHQTSQDIQNQSINRGQLVGDSFCRKPEGDSMKDRMMKQKKSSLELKISQNEQHYDKYIALESYLQQQFVEKLKATYNQKENITELIQNLIDAWNYRNICYTERIEFIGRLEYFQSDFDGVYTTLNSHYETLRNDILISQRIIEKMNSRENLLIQQYQQEQISHGQSVDPDQFNQSARLSARKVNQDIKTIDLEIVSLIEEFQTIYKKAFTWQGFMLKDLIEIELWEESKNAQNMQDIKSLILEKLQYKLV